MNQLSDEDIKQIKYLGLNPENKNHITLALGNISDDIELSPSCPSSGWKITLMRHQRMSVSMMKRYEEDENYPNVAGEYIYKIGNRKMSILADPAGSGKSYTILARISQQPHLTKTVHMIESNVRLTHNSRVVVRLSDREMVGSINVILTPHSLISQWTTYLMNTDLKYYVINTASCLEKCERHLTDGTVVFLVSSTRYADFLVKTRELNIVFSRFIVDEYDSIAANGFYNPPPSVFIWGVSASIRLLSTLGSYSHTSKRLINFIHTECAHDDLADIIVKAPWKTVRDCLNLPSFRTNIITVRQRNVVNVLSSVLQNEVRSMLNADDLSAVANYLEMKRVPSDTDLINHFINKYTDDNKTQEKRIGYYTDIEINQEKVEKCIDKINENNKIIESIKSRLNSDDMTCGICLVDPIDKPCTTPCCHEKWCFECIVNCILLMGKCPKCRTLLKPDQLVCTSQLVGPSPIHELPMFQTKIEAFRDLLITLNNKPLKPKILCFAEYVGGFNDIVAVCNELRIKNNIIKGTAKHIDKLINDWKKSTKISVLLLNADRFGAGLNLQEGTDIVLWHKMEKSTSDLEHQIISRVVRLGVVDPPTVHKLVYTGE